MYLSPIWRVTTSSSATFCCAEAFDRYRYLTRYRAVSRVLYLARERAAVKIHSRCANRADTGTRNRATMNTRPFTVPNTYLNYRKLTVALTFHMAQSPNRYNQVLQLGSTALHGEVPTLILCGSLYIVWGNGISLILQALYSTSSHSHSKEKSRCLFVFPI